MSAKKIILFILGAFSLIFGFLFLLGSGGQGGGGTSWIIYGGIFVLVGLAIVYLATKITAPAPEVNVTYQVDLPGEVNMEKIKCVSCGGVISQKDISMVNGAPVVSCPWCGTTYQLTEDPKW